MLRGCKQFLGSSGNDQHPAPRQCVGNERDWVLSVLFV